MRKDEVKLSLFADAIILYIENLEDSTKKLLEIINKFSKFERYTMNIKNHLIPYTNSKMSEK